MSLVIIDWLLRIIREPPEFTILGNKFSLAFQIFEEPGLWLFTATATATHGAVCRNEK